MDDLDYYDLGVYGSPDIQTPTLDTLAATGLRFDRYYSSAPVCSPSRVALLTGRHPAPLGFLRAVSPTSLRGIPSAVPTLPAVLQTAGYRTVHVGKWHVGFGRDIYTPTRKGFDRSFRFDGSGYFDQSLLVDDERQETFGDGAHLTTVLTDLAIEQLRESLSDHPDEPIFLNLWHFAPHNPVELPRDYDNSKTRYCLAPGDSSCDFQRGRYAALVTHADQEIGRLLRALEELDIAKQTLVMVASDNGGTPNNHNPDTLPYRPLSGFKVSLQEGGIRVPMIVKWPGKIDAGSVSNAVVTGVDVLPTLAEVAGAPLHDVQIDGVSFLSLLRGEPATNRTEPLTWENKPSTVAPLDFSRITNTFAVRNGPWKLLYQPAMTPTGSDRRSLYKLDADPAERHDLLASNASQELYRVLVNELEQFYWDWRRQTGGIPYRVAAQEPAADLAHPAERDPAPGRVLEFDERLDFNDGDFTFLTAVKPDEADMASGTIAERLGSWRLFFQDGCLVLDVRGKRSIGVREDTGNSLRLKGPCLTAGRWYHVAFTAYGFRDAPTVLRLYVDGEVAAQSSAGNRVASVAGGDDTSGFKLILGNDAGGTSPITGEVDFPRLYSRSFYATEVMATYAEWLAGSSFHRRQL
jgi:arylsulfatase A-like enzyme